MLGYVILDFLVCFQNFNSYILQYFRNHTMVLLEGEDLDADQ